MKETKIFFPNSLFCDIVSQQQDKGLEKYGHTLKDCPVEKFDWITMMLEELADYHQYVQKFIEAKNTMPLRIKAEDGKYSVRFGRFVVCQLEDYEDARKFIESLKAL